MGKKMKQKRRREEKVSEAEVPEKITKSDSVLESRKVFIKDINRLLSISSFVLIKGPISCGKTFCARKLAKERNLPVHTFHVNEDLDAKSLFGTYKCTNIPGEFVWTPTTFAKCLREESLILFEDLDMGTPDLISVVFHLCEKREYTLHNGERCQLHSKCRLLSTVMSGRESGLGVIREYPFFVELPPFSNAELDYICTIKFSRISSVKTKILQIFNDVCQEMAANCPMERQLSSKDLFRLCKRLNQFSDFTDNILIFNEISDLFLMHLTDTKCRQRIACVVAGRLSIAESQINFLYNVRKPDIRLENDFLTIGNNHFRRKAHNTRQISFALTRDCSQLMERIAKCVDQREAVLLSGETGVGKTSVVQLLAFYSGISLKVVNFSEDSDFSDFVGGYKPTHMLNIIRPIADQYFDIFRKTFSGTKNSKFLIRMEKILAQERIEDFLKLVVESGSRAAKSKLSLEWANVVVCASRLLHYVQSSSCAFPFAFIAGVVTRATESGDWLLIDELNLAPPECLDAIMQIIDSDSSSLHPEFRLFACMNPGTDVGKRCLANGVRSKFTEFFVAEPADPTELAVIVQKYLSHIESSVCDAIVNFYQEVCRVVAGKYSLRTLCRALDIVKGHSAVKIHRQNESLQLAFRISFSSNLINEEQSTLALLLEKYFGKSTNMLKSFSAYDKSYISIEGHLIKRGNAVPEEDSLFIFTPTVRSNLSFLACVVANGQFPILLEGETSAGKTSIVHYLGKVSGNVVHRINNHEHTDVQEYIGSYAPNASGHIEFIEGVLLKAVRNGDWIILDELNLAPSIVLEALNRLLDDNREIHVPELNVTVAAHPQFRLFATQNPAGSYLGRKRLSRAFLNRFVIIKYDHLPFGELPKIVEGRCRISPSLSEKMVDVLVELKARRSSNGIFAFSNGLMTLRDLFRWGYRVAKTDSDKFDWRQVAIDQGYFVLASRCRSVDDEKVVIEVLEKCLKRKVDVVKLFSFTSKYMPKEVVARAESKNILLSASMRRMLVLCTQAWRYNEPVLLVGETGCGKTTVAQLLNSMLSINCHERTETADFLGSVRPTSDGKFQWADGIVVQAMRTGERLLVDEISLAPDSVLERLNSLLESDRCIMLTDGVQEPEIIIAHEEFQIIATMNPGDDHGKKELSKALRNRFLEIWCKAEHSQEEMQNIIERRITSEIGDLINAAVLSKVSTCVVGFFHYFQVQHGHLFKTIFSIRDLISVCELFISCYRSKIPIFEAIIHAMSACLFDAFGVLPCRISFNRDALLADCIEKLKAILLDSQICDDKDASQLMTDTFFPCEFSERGLQVGRFLIERGLLEPKPSATFAFDAPTARQNLLRVARGFASTKPIMLEGSPGAGKSSLIMAIAAATGNPLHRLNLSEQTDLYDLFGSDVPIVDVNGRTSFVWKDGPVLKAIKSGAWILLDEMNLASQSVLEGLNSCFDFRKTLYISELRKTFTIEATQSRFFACQNPRSQGGDRKALPKSFLNRFTSIYVTEMSSEDFEFILCQLHGEKLPFDLIHKMIVVNEKVAALGLINGGPFEFNMRDLLRWANTIEQFGVKFGFELIYVSRIRDVEDAIKLRKIFNDSFLNGDSFLLLNTDKSPMISKLMESLVQNILLPDHVYSFFDETIFAHGTSALRRVLFRLAKLLVCVELNWLALLVGDFSDSMPLMLNVLASLAGKDLRLLRLTSETDSLELLGSYEQITDCFDLNKEKMAINKIVQQYCAGDEKRIFSEHISNCVNLSELYALAQEIVVVQPIDELSELINRLSGATNARFKWIDSNFVKAYQNGYWILIQDVNCCSCAVLDCLNSCLEDGGELLIPERFGEEIVQRHPDFRIFFTMNPANGPLSRAMRNRSVEIFAGMDKFWSLTDFDQSASLARFFELNSAAQTDAFSERKQLVVEKAEPTVINWIFFWSLGCSLTRTAGSSGDTVDNSIDFCNRIECFSNELMSRIDWDILNDHLVAMKPDFTSSLIQFGICEPFSNETHFRLCLESLPPNAEAASKMEVDLSVTDGHNDASDISLFLSKICAFFSTLDELISGKMQKRADRGDESIMKAFYSLPWTNEIAKRVFCFLEFLNTNIDFVGEKDSKNSFSLLHSSFLSIMVDNYWSMFGYSSMPTWVQLKDSTRPLADLNQLRGVLWKLTFSRNSMLNRVNNQMKLIGDWFHSHAVAECRSRICSTHELLNFIRSSLELLKALTPPPDSVDVSVQIASELGGHGNGGVSGAMREKLRIVSIYFQALKKFLYATTRHCDDTFFDNLTFPILRLLWKSTSKPSTDYGSASNDCVIVIDDDDNGGATPPSNLSTYRPASKQFYQLVGFLQEFTTMTSTFYSSVLQSEIVSMLSEADDNDLSLAALVRISSQICSFIKSATFFRRKLLEQYLGYPDVALTYSAVVDLLLLAIQSMLDRFFAIQRRLHATRELKFPEANFELCYLNSNEYLTPLDDLFAWALSEHSTLPLNFQLDVVHYQLRHCNYAKGVIDWIYGQWRHRFECIAKKETKWFEYRKTGQNRNEDEILDEDRVEFNYYFPDYSDATPEDEDFSEPGSAAEQRLKRRFAADNNLINDWMVVEMLQLIANINGEKISEDSVFSDTEKIYFAVMRLFSDLELSIDEERNQLLNYFHLIQLAKTSRFLNAKCSSHGGEKKSLSAEKSGKVLNVYMESDYDEVRRGVSALRVLECRVRAIHDEFPENQILAAILDSVAKFFAVPSTQPLMKLTSMLEKVLMQADEWQQLADRAHSIREELLTLQHILVGWRQMEVLSWSTLIERVERDCAESALIAAFPLFEAVNVWFVTESDEDGVENKLLLMLIEWIQNASMVDFSQRLFSGELLARFAEIKLGQSGGNKSTAISSLPRRIRLVVAYFGIFRAEIAERYASEKRDVAEKLSNFVELFRYNDLNLWSVRQSAQKVHAQLFRIVKRLKECCRQSISDVLFDKPLPNTSPGIIKFNFINHPQVSNNDTQHNVEERFCNITDRLNSILSEAVDVETLTDLADASDEYLSILQTQIVYDAATEEENEKLQGRALFERQKRFAFLIRSLFEFGWSSRRGLEVNSEALTIAALSEVDFDGIFAAKPENTDFGDQMRFAIAIRNVVLRKHAGVRLNQNEHLKRQLPMSMFSHICGLTEFGLFWTVKAATHLSKHLSTYIVDLEQLHSDFDVLNDNYKTAHHSLNHAEISSIIRTSIAQLRNIWRVLDMAKSVLDACPEGDDLNGTNCDWTFALSAEVGTSGAASPLASLTKSSSVYRVLDEALHTAHALLEQCLQSKAVLNGSTIRLWKIDQLISFRTTIEAPLLQLQSTHIPLISKYFCDESDLLSELCKSLLSGLTILPGPSTLCDDSNALFANLSFDDSITSILLKIQQAFKGLSARAELTDVANSPKKLLDRIKRMIEYVCGLDIDSIVRILSSIRNLLLDSSSQSIASVDDLINAKYLSAGVAHFLRCILDHFASFLQHFSQCYVSFETVACHVITNGFVNAIPQQDKGVGDGKAKESGAVDGDACGMGDADPGGDASDARDVGAELDNMGQVEGLKKDEAESQNKLQENESTENEQQQPIEMEDDFLGELEGLDDVERDDRNNEDDNNGEDEAAENNIDWEKGDVEEPDEKQLDPELWDKSMDQEPVEVADDGTDAANQETGEMTAAAPESTVGAKEDAADDNENDELDGVNEKENELNDDIEESGGVTVEKATTDEEAENETNSKEDAENEANSNLDMDGLDISENEEEDANGSDAGNDEDTKNFADNEENADKRGESEPKESEVDEDKAATGYGKADDVAENERGQSDNTEPTDVDENRPSSNDDETRMEVDSIGNGMEEENSRPVSKGEKKRQDHQPLDRKLEDEKAKSAEKEGKSKKDLADNEDNDVEIIEGLEVGSDKDDDEMGEIGGGDRLAADSLKKDEVKHVIQKSSMEEAVKTKRLLDKLNQFAKSSTLELEELLKSSEDQNEREKEEETLEFSRYEGTSSMKDMIVISRELVHTQKSLISLDNKLDEELYSANADGMSSSVDQQVVERAMEIRWAIISNSVSQLSSLLAENLRMIIEPTIASRLQGDYRTGKRLNIRRLISYVASDYRKDRIWMRRTKKVKRNYQICIAVDDSASVEDNAMSTIICHSLCLIEKALMQLEIGRLMICKFGNTVKVLRDFSSSSNNELGARLMSELTFAQERTNLVNLLGVVNEKFKQARRFHAAAEQMLIVLSDGRGVLADGLDRVRAAQLQMEAQQITVLFLIIDNGKKSIMDVKVAMFEKDGGVRLVSYMEQFPFPFYAIINGLQMLPATLASAIQQWFEFTLR